MSKPLSPAEIQALNLVRESMRTNFKRTFTGATFAARGEQLAEGIGQATDTVVEVVDTVCGDMAQLAGYADFKQGFTAVAQPGPFLWDLLKKVSGMDQPGEIVAALGPGVLTGFFEAAVPYWGAIKGGLEAGKKFCGAIGDLRASWQAQEQLPAVQIGAPAAALGAVGTLLKRRSNDQFAEGTIKAVESAVNATLVGTGAGGLATGGVSLASKLAGIVVVVRRRVLEYKEVQKGKAALMQPEQLSPKVFEVCPLLGCYLLTNSDTSSIVMSCFAQGQITGNFMSEVEKNKRGIDPLLDAAREFIRDSVFELRGPGITTRATKGDQRPWIERFWVGRFGAMNKGYRVIRTGKAAAGKAATVKDVATDTLRSAYKKALELLLQGKEE